MILGVVNLKQYDTFQFNITQVAAQIGVAPVTLRNWEKRGIFIPKRSANGYRVFSVEDIETLQRIKNISNDKDLNVEAIKMLAGTTSHSAVEKGPEETVSKQVLGERWKNSRIEKGYTLEQVAQAVGVSISYISKIENAQANVSFEILQRLAQFYGESVSFYFKSEKKDNGTPSVTRKGEGEKLSIGLRGVSMESLGLAASNLNINIYTVRPGYGQMIPNQHNGEEIIYVLDGKVTFTLGETDIYEISQGDCVHYPANTRHQWQNNGTVDAVLLWIFNPFSFPNL